MRQQHRIPGFHFFPATIAVQHGSSGQLVVDCALHIILAVPHHQDAFARQAWVLQHKADHIRLVVHTFVHAGPANAVKIVKQPLLFQDGCYNFDRFAGCRCHVQPGIFQGIHHLTHPGEQAALVAANFLVMHAVILHGLLHLGIRCKVLGKAPAQRRAKVAGTIYRIRVKAHFAERIGKAVKNARPGMDQCSINIK